MGISKVINFIPWRAVIPVPRRITRGPSGTGFPAPIRRYRLLASAPLLKRPLLPYRPAQAL